jgi:peptide chain release factor 2
VSIFDVAGKRARVGELEALAAAPDFWNDQAAAQKTMAQIASLKDDIGACESLVFAREEVEVLHDLALSSQDEELGHELETSLAKILADTDKLEVATWFSGEFDAGDAIVTVKPGAGGLESQDWATMLLRMLLRYAETQRWKVDLDEVAPDEEGTIKSATFTVHARYAFGMLQSEKGVHRLVRMSPFDNAGRRHTSFALVDVLPVLPKDIDLSIDPKDLRIDTYRSSSAGGQHVNVTDSAVRITHLPTGIVAACQNERSQMQNKEKAMEILRSRIYEYREREREKELEAIRGERQDIAFGSQIRSYVLAPYTMVKDHRTGIETGNAQGVLDGDLEQFVLGYHRWRGADGRAKP